MRAYEYILTKQTQWALSHGIELMGSKGQRGRRAYTPQLTQNLFEPLEPSVHKSFSKGDGNEINGTPDSPAKMQAVHSSSALGVNIFQYWQKRDLVPLIAAACGFCRKGSNISEDIVFEDKYPIDDTFGIAPNVDVVIHNSETAKYKRFAIECKFSEAYGGMRHGGLKSKYMGLSKIWDDIPELEKLAKSISPEDNDFSYLHPAQLIKHILGLKNKFEKDEFRLLYLWYDVFGEEGAIHRDEIQDFSKAAKADSVKFHAMSYQELIIKLSNEYREQHCQYINYITDRYL